MESDPRLAEHRARWDGKPVLRRIYEDYHRRMQDACRPGRTLEIGAGSGRFGEVGPVVTIDILPAVWLDAVADAEVLPFATASFDNVVLLDVLHHIERPRVFFAEAARVLRPGGRLVMIEPGITPVSWLFYKLLHPEPVDMAADPLADADPDPARDPFADANQAIPTLLFARARHRRRFAAAFPGLRIAAREWLSLFAYPLSGGYRDWSLVPEALVGPLLRLENLLLPLLGPIMAFRLALILERRADHSEVAH